jgi:Tfp pilus assembly protein PilN
MTNTKKNKQWYFSRQVDLSVLVQIAFLAVLIVGTWVNLQKQLSLLQHDITSLLETQKQFQQRLEELNRLSITYEYRLRWLEKQTPEAENSKKGQKGS